jgi:hypothetical protein
VSRITEHERSRPWPPTPGSARDEHGGEHTEAEDREPEDEEVRETAVWSCSISRGGLFRFDLRHKFL